MDKLVAMNVFRTVVECGSFAKASEKLGISTTTTSRQVGELELALGVSLLHRSTRRISLTECGMTYYGRCCQHLEDIAATEMAMCGEKAQVRGTLRLSVPYSFGNAFLAPHIPRFMEMFPELRIDIAYSDRIVDLAQDGIDLAVRICREVNSMYVARRLAPVHVVLCASPDYLARHGVPRHPDDLCHHNCLCYANLPTGNLWLLHKDGEDFSVAIHGTLRSNNGEMNRLAALAGRGLIREPTFIIGDDLRAGRLVRVLSEYMSPPVAAHAVYLPAGRSSARIRAVIDFLVGIFGEHAPSWDRDLGLAWPAPYPVAPAASPVAAPLTVAA